MIDQSNKNENESKYVLELYNDCEKGLYININKQLESMDFSKKTLDTAIRRTIKNSKRERKEYYDCLSLLLKHVDINYNNPNESNSTLFMLACSRGDINIVDLILAYDYSNNANFSGQKADLSRKDDLNRNFLHYLVNKENPEDDAYEIFEYFTNTYNESLHSNAIPEVIEEEIKTEKLNSQINSTTIVSLPVNISQELNIEDKDGYTPLALSLKAGWFKLSKRFLQLKAKERHIIKSNNSNLIHCAIEGKNLNCVKLILRESRLEDIRFKNKEGLTPAEFAKKLRLNYISKIIENFEENCHNQNFLNLFGRKDTIKANDVLEKFVQEDYSETLFLLNQLKINQNIQSTITKNYNIEWNIFLTTFYIKIIKNTKENGGKQLDSVEKYGIGPESILSKFVDDNDNSSKRQNILTEFENFFEQIKITSDKIDDNSNPIDIIIFNKGSFYFKIGDFFKTLKIYLEYLKVILDQYDNMYYKWIIYVNITFILIEGLINLKYTKLVNCLIEKLEEFLFTNFRLKKDDIYTHDLNEIVNYMNSKEIINKFSATWDESFCYLNLLKAMKNINEVKLDEAKVFLKDFQKII